MDEPKSQPAYSPAGSTGCGVGSDLEASTEVILASCSCRCATVSASSAFSAAIRPSIRASSAPSRSRKILKVVSHQSDCPAAELPVESTHAYCLPLRCTPAVTQHECRLGGVQPTQPPPACRLAPPPPSLRRSVRWPGSGAAYHTAATPDCKGREAMNIYDHHMFRRQATRKPPGVGTPAPRHLRRLLVRWVAAATAATSPALPTALQRLRNLLARSGNCTILA